MDILKLHDKYKEKVKRVNIQISWIKKILKQNKLTNVLLISYLEKLLPYLERNSLIIEAGSYASRNLALRLLNFRNHNVDKVAYWLANFTNRSFEYELLYSIFGENDRLIFRQIVLPSPVNSLDKDYFSYEFLDNLFPYLFEEEDVNIDDFGYYEGPYEINNDICLKHGDIVIDCGANMGFFSAIASVRGCKVYAFEPMDYVT